MSAGKWKSGRVPEKGGIWASTQERSGRVPGKVGSERVSEKIEIWASTREGPG